MKKGRDDMKAVFAIALTIGTLVAASAPALAKNSAYCLQSREWGYPGNCQFSSYRQCAAAASGTNATCGRNPMSAHGRYRR
jgi:hypothetical protein